MSTVQRLTLGLGQSWTVVDSGGLPIPPIERWLEQLRVTNAAPNTVRAYAAGLALWWVFLEVDGLDWGSVGIGEVASFVSWMRYRQPERSPSEATLSARLAAVVAFYRFHEAFSGAPSPRVSTRSAGAGEDRAGACWPTWRITASTVCPLSGFDGIARDHRARRSRRLLRDSDETGGSVRTPGDAPATHGLRMDEGGQETLQGSLLAQPRLEPDVARATRVDAETENRRSIAILVDFDGSSCLLPGDLTPHRLEQAVRLEAGRLGEPSLRVDAIVAPHRGSRHSVTRSLVSALACPNWLFAPDGSKYGHPDPEAIARVITGTRIPTTLHFAYRTPQTERWDDPTLKRRYRYETRYPASGDEAGISLELLSAKRPSSPA